MEGKDLMIGLIVVFDGGGGCGGGLVGVLDAEGVVVIRREERVGVVGILICCLG